MKTIIYEILKKMTNISKPQHKFMEDLLCTMLFMGGRMNIRNVSRYGNYCERTVARNFEKDFDYLQFNCNAINRITSIDENKKRYAIGYDPFFIQKSGKHTYGRESFWNGSQQKSEKGLEGNGFALINVDQKIAYPLSVAQTPPKHEIVEALKNPDANRMDYYVSCVKAHLDRLKGANLQIDVKHVIADAYFANNKFISMVRKAGFHMVGKLRSDANLRSLVFEQNEGRGRPRIYGEKVNVKDITNFAFVESVKGNNDKEKGDLYEGTFYSINLKCQIKVACLLVKHENKVSMVLMFSTDLDLSAKDIFDFYTARFQIEFVFRDGKQFAGLTEFQTRSKMKIHNHLNASFSVVLLAKIQEIEARLSSNIKVPFSMHNHKRRNYNEMLVSRIFSILGIDPSLIKLSPEIWNVVEMGVI